MKIASLVLVLFLSACATTNSKIDTRKEDVLHCIKDLKVDESVTDAFEVCRQIYGMKKVKEKR